MKSRSASVSQAVPLDIVGSSKFGRHPKISAEKTLNMFSADNFSINFAGYDFACKILDNGRGFFSSLKANAMFAVSNKKVYKISSSLNPIEVMSLTTDTGDVSIDEDLLGKLLFVMAQIFIFTIMPDCSTHHLEHWAAG